MPGRVRVLRLADRALSRASALITVVLRPGRVFPMLAGGLVGD